MGLPGRSLRALWGPLAALAALAVAPPAPAHAGGDYTVSEVMFTVPDGAQDGAQAQCPGSGDIAINGGVYTSYALGQTWLGTSRPGFAADPFDADAWYARVDNAPGGAVTTADVTAFAVCHTDGNGDYKVRRKRDVPLHDGKRVTYFQRCKDDEAVVGGGAEAVTGPADLASLSTSAPRDDGDRDKRPDGWYEAVQVVALDGAADMDVYAVCDQERKPRKYRYVTNEAKVQIADNDQGSVTAICDVLEPRVGGGVTSHAKYKHDLRINSTYPEGGTFGTGWSAFVDNMATPDNQAREITATAICRK